MIDLTVIIPVYNAGLLIGRCLDSIFTQHGGYEVEVICIDDGSTDNSVEIIENRKEPNISLLRQPNSGPAAARNKGIAAAKGRYLALLDADDYWQPGFIAETVSFLDAHLECIAVSVAQRHITLSGDHLAPAYISESGHREEGFVLDDFYTFWSKYNHVCTGSITIRTKIAQQTGGQREELRICEDLEFWAYLATFGQLGFIPKVLFVSDGNKIVSHYGFKKYSLRFKNIQTFNVWNKRLNSNLSKENREKIAERLNNVVVGITRALISAGELKKARQNLAYYQSTSSTSHYIVRISNKGLICWYLYGTIYRIYRYLRVNWPYYKHILTKWKE